MPDPDPRLLALGRAVRKMRRDQDLSQEALAHLASIHPNIVGRLEGGVRDVRVSTLMRLADGLGVPLSEVVRVYEQRLAADR